MALVTELIFVPNDPIGNIESTLNWLPMTTLVKQSVGILTVGIPGMHIVKLF